MAFGLTPQQSFRVGAAIYAVSALAFLAELAGEITGIYILTSSWLVHEITALVKLAGFIVGGVMIWRGYDAIRQRNRKVEQTLRSARGEFFEMLNLQFDRWDLTDAERDVALLTVKGMSVAEIASIRNTSQGTIKSQNNAIYRKADVKGRTQLLGVLIDELLIEDS